MVTKRNIERSIKRAKERLEDLEKRKERLSIHGYWSIGYWEGKINVLEDWLDELTEMEENGQKNNVEG